VPLLQIAAGGLGWYSTNISREGGEVECATHNSWWPSHARDPSGILRKLLSPLIILADERDRTFGYLSCRPW
jgi:hypothetical protein